MTDDDPQLAEAMRRAAERRRELQPEIEAMERKAERERVEGAGKALEAAARKLGLPADTSNIPPPPPPTGCEVCDHTFELDEAPWWTVQNGRLCVEHARAVTLRHAEHALTAVIPPRQQSARDVLPELADWSPLNEARLGVYLHGKVGRGKSYQAAALLKRGWMRWAREKGAPPKVAWWHVGRLLQRMRATMNGGQAKAGWLDQLYEVDILVLDDLGAERVTDWTREQVLLLVSERYDAGRITIITSNFGLGGLAERLSPPDDPDDPAGQRIASRIAESCQRVEVTGPDRRLQGGAVPE